MEPQGWLTTERAAQETGYNVDYLRRLAQKGKIEGIKVGNAWLIRLQSLLDYEAASEKRGPHEEK